MYKIIDDFLEKEDFDVITSTFFPEDLNNPNNFSWTYQKGIVRDPEIGPTDYEEHDWIYVTTSNGFTVLKGTTEVQCVENRMLLFDGYIEHHSVTSTDSPRCVININFWRIIK